MRAHLSKPKKSPTGDRGGVGANVPHAASAGAGRFPRSLVAGLALGAAALGLAACGSAGAHVVGVASTPGSATSPTPNAVAGGRYAQIVSMSGLEVAPPAAGTTGRHLGLTWAQAAALFEATSAVQGSRAHAILGYGLVTLTGSPLPAGTPALDRRGAWVGITWGGATSCPAETSSSTSASPGSRSHRQIFTAVVIYGEGGDGAIVYSSRGRPPCGGALTGPTVGAAGEVLSVPWRQTTPLHGGAIHVSYRAPGCATLFSTAGDGNIRTGQLTLAVEVTVPFEHAGCRTTTRTTSVRLFPASTAPGAPVAPTHVALSHGSTGLVTVLEAGHIAGTPSGASADASSIAPIRAEPASTGILSGVLEMVGGPAPGPARPLPGTVTVRRSGQPPVEVSAGKDGAFSVELPAGTYQVTARSPLYQDGAALRRACR